MFFEYDITVPAQTSQANALRQDLGLKWGTLKKIAVQFPDGCYGLVHAQLWSGRHQVAPQNELGSIKGNNTTVEFGSEVELREPPYLVTAVAWNDDDSYAHTLTIRLEVEIAAILYPEDLGIPQVMAIPEGL